MEKIQVYLRPEELEALREAAERSGRSVADLVREAIRKTVLKPKAGGPAAIWDGQPKRTSLDHDSIYDDLRCGNAKPLLSTAGLGSRVLSRVRFNRKRSPPPPRCS